MQLKVIKIRTKDNKRLESFLNYKELPPLEKIKNSFNLFYPTFYKAYAVYDGDKLLFSRGEI